MQRWDQLPAKKTLLLLWALVGLVVVALYAPFGLYYLNDDFIHIPLSEQAVFGQRHSIRVMNDFSLYLDSLLYGKNAVGYHFTNLLLHLANTVLLFFTSKKILGLMKLPNSSLVAHATCFFFILYPFHSESVFWLIGRTGALSTLWMQLALLAQMRRSFWWQMLGCLLYLAGLFTYESVLVYPVLLGAIWLYRKQQKANDASHWLQQMLMAAAATIAYILIRVVMLGGVTDHYESGSLLTGQLSTLFSNYAALLLRLFVPPFVSNTWLLITAVIILLPILILVVYHWKQWAGNLWKFFLLKLVLLASLLPYISLGIDTHGVESERYLYVPSLLLALLAAQVLRWCNMQQRWLLSGIYAVFAIAFLLQSSLSFRRASAVAETVVTTTNTFVQPQHRFIYYFNMPGEHKGVVLLRTGLPEAVAWLVPAAAGKTVYSIAPDMQPFLQIPKLEKTTLVSKAQFVQMQHVPDSVQLKQSLLIAYQKGGLLVAQ